MKIVGSRRTRINGEINAAQNQESLNQENNNDLSRDMYIQEYLLEDGRVINSDQAYDMAKNGQLEGVIASTNQGTKYIRSYADGNKTNNLSDLPTF